MNAKFYYNKSDRIVLNKDISEKDSVTVRYKGDTDLINPIFIVNADKIDDKINYIYIGGDIKRYYFIDSVIFSQGHIELKCSIDVLMSHRSEIENQECIIIRNEKIWNMYLSDDRMELYHKPRYLTFPFEHGFTEYYDGTKYGSMVMTINGGGVLDE